MSWCVYRLDADHTGIDLEALVDPSARVISEHDSIHDARKALAEYRQRCAEEAEWHKRQGELFG